MSSLSKISWNKFKKDPLGLAGFFIIVLTIFISLFVYLISPDNSPNANKMHLEIALKKPLFKVSFLQIPKPEVENISLLERWFKGQPSVYNEIPISDWNEFSYQDFSEETDLPWKALPDSNYLISNKTYYLGTDKYGRDLLSRILIGTRISLSVGFISVFISLLIGIFLGSIAGYYKGWVDDFIMWLVNVVWSIPTLLMVIALSLAFGKGLWQVFVVVGLTMWVEIARVVRGEVLGISAKEYVEAAKVLGFHDFRIIFSHILPNVMSSVIIISAANFAAAILIEAGLSFLGIGAAPPIPSWGAMIKDHYAYIVMDKAYLALFPGLAIMLLVLAFVLVGNALRDALDVKS